MPPPSRRGLAAAALAALLAAGCAGFHAEARNRYLGSELKGYEFRESCSELWPTALKVVSGRGFPVVGADRERIGEAPEGGFASVFSAGFATRSTPDGGLVAETDWNKAVGTRYRVEGAPAGASACRVSYLTIAGGVTADTQETTGPDWTMLLDLVAAVDPPAAARIEAGAPRS